MVFAGGGVEMNIYILYTLRGETECGGGRANERFAVIIVQV